MKSTQKNKVLLAIPKDYERFNELWTPEADLLAAELNLHVDFIEKTPSCAEEWKSVMTRHQVIITSWCTPALNRDLLPENSKVKLIAHAAGSVADLVTSHSDSRFKITTANSIMAGAVAEWCVTMTWMGLNNMLKYANFGGMRPMNWVKNGSDFRNIQGATIGIWGYGDISRRYIRLLKSFSPKKIMVCSNHLHNHSDEFELASLDKLFSCCDVIVLLAALTPHNKGKISDKLLAKLKQSAVLLNPGRGGLINEKALLQVLRQNCFSFIADSFHHEPLPDNDPLQQFPNVILTPHCAGRNTDRYVPAMLKEADRFYQGESLLYEVSRERKKTMTSNSLNYE